MHIPQNFIFSIANSIREPQTFSTPHTPYALHSTMANSKHVENSRHFPGLVIRECPTHKAKEITEYARYMLEAAIVDALDSDEDSGDEVEDLRR
jgi:hypothetical protein